MAFRYFLRLAYDGSDYHGWQVQKSAVSVQETIEQALAGIWQQPVPIMGAGRTDTGVHASDFWAHFDLKQNLDKAQKHELVHQLNEVLPEDIRIYGLYAVQPKAHARFDATARTYQYFICPQKNVFAPKYSWHLFGDLDYQKMNEAAKVLFDYKDFTSFSKLHTQVKTNNCRIDKACWEHYGSYWVFTIKADRFLRNMVRAVVGTLLEVGKGKMDVDGFRHVIEKKDRSSAGLSVPGRALFLTQIDYPDSSFIDHPDNPDFVAPPKPMDLLLLGDE